VCVGELVLCRNWREFNVQAVSLARGPVFIPVVASNGLPNLGAISTPRGVGLVGDSRDQG
jgi:hypothetical protein